MHKKSAMNGEFECVACVPLALLDDGDKYHKHAADNGYERGVYSTILEVEKRA